MLNEKSEIAFWSDESRVESIACILSGHFQLEVTDASQASFNTKWAFTGFWEVGGWWGEPGTQGLLHRRAVTTRSQDENWLNWGDGVEKSSSMSQSVSEPEPENGNYLASALTARQDHSSGLNVGSLYSAMAGHLASLPHWVYKTFQTHRDLKQGCCYLNLTFLYRSFAHRFQRIQIEELSSCSLAFSYYL